jgi:hypothetical protein
MRAWLMMLVLASVPLGAQAGTGRDWDLCKADDADQPALAACTRLIGAQTLAGRELAEAYFLRGHVEWRLREIRGCNRR